MTDLDEYMKVIKWARKRGACLIKVGPIELTFPPGSTQPLASRSQPKPISVSTDAKAAEAFIRNPTVLDDPDYYGQEQDRWATHSRPPPLG